MKNWIRIISTIVIVLVVDLTTKHFLFRVDYFNLIPNVISIATNGGNSGAAWGIFSGKKLFLILMSVAMIVALFAFNHFVKKKNWTYCLSFGFIVGGAVGNLIDRIAFGYVRDFIFLDFWKTFPIFNMADSFLCVGAVMLCVYVLFMSGNKNEK